MPIIMVHFIVWSVAVSSGTESLLVVTLNNFGDDDMDR